MIEANTGNLLQVDAEALVNTVNCVGFMGKGIALQFKQAFPDNFKAYERACKQGLVRPGKMFIFKTGLMMNPKYIINFPSKRHWRGNSKLDDIAKGLVALIEEVKQLKIQSIAVPPIGCGNGGLDWSVVRPMIESSFAKIPDVHVLLFAPLGAPKATAMPVRTEKPDMTPARALFVKLIEQYLTMTYRLTLLEVQKLAYFLQEAGEPLKLKYEAGRFGPFAANLNKVLEKLEGHYVRGYGDSQQPDAELEILPGAIDSANSFLQAKEHSLSRLERVNQLIEGFETPYGMELLSSVHWVAKHSDPPADRVSAAIEAVQSWNDRKRLIFKPRHIEVAWTRLEQESWLHK